MVLGALDRTHREISRFSAMPCVFNRRNLQECLIVA